MASRMIGVEIGSNTIKIAVAKGGVIIDVVAERMPTDMVREGRPTSVNAMASFIRQVMREYRIPRGQCAMVLPSNIILGHHVTMPLMSHEELLLNLPFEFRDFVGKDGAKYDYDYVVNDVHDNVMDLYAAAVRKDIVEEYYEIFHKAGMTLKAAIPPEMAWQNLVANTAGLPNKLCIVDVGHSNTRVSLFAGGKFVMGKEIELAGSFIDETIASSLQIDAFAARTQKENNLNHVLSSELANDAYQALAIEVMKIINYFNYADTTEGGQLLDLFYTGGSSVIEPLRTALVKATGITLHHVHRLVPMEDVASDDALYGALAAGAAIQK